MGRQVSKIDLFRLADACGMPYRRSWTANYLALELERYVARLKRERDAFLAACKVTP